MSTDTSIPARQEFRADQRVQFLAAVNAAARDPMMLLTIETDPDGNTVAIIHRAKADESFELPESLGQYLQDQQDSLRMVSSVLVCIGEALQSCREEPEESAAMAMVHAIQMLGETTNALDSVNLKRAMVVKS